MAIIEGILTEAQILGFRGQIDFYYHRGQLIARAWPKKRTIPPTAAEASNQTFFGQIQTKIRNMPEVARQQWREFVYGKNIVWTDAIRFFNLTGNPDKDITQTVWFAFAVISQPSPGIYLLVFAFNHLESPFDHHELGTLIQSQDSDPGPVVWQNVGFKCRRRAIIDQKIRPALSGWIDKDSLSSLASEPWATSRYLNWFPRPFFQVAVTVRPDFLMQRLQTPVYQFEVTWPAVGGWAVVYPRNITVEPVDPDTIPDWMKGLDSPP